MNVNKVCYACTFVEKTATEDNYENGEVGATATVLWDEQNITAPTLKELWKKIQETFFLEKTNHIFMPSESVFSVCQLETENSETPTQQEKVSWMNGKIKLYNCDYTFFVEKRVVEPVDLSEFEGLGIYIEKGYEFL